MDAPNEGNSPGTGNLLLILSDPLRVRDRFPDS